MATADQIAREMESFYRDYIDVFNREEEAMFDSFASPHAMVSGERGLTTVANDENHRAAFRRMIATLKERGWAHSGIDSIKAWPMADNLGLLVCDVTRYKADNSVLEKLRACYLLQRDGGKWKILTLNEIKPPFLGPGDLPR
jgi:hypothetical protein